MRRIDAGGGGREREGLPGQDAADRAGRRAPGRPGHDSRPVHGHDPRRVRGPAVLLRALARARSSSCIGIPGLAASSPRCWRPSGPSIWTRLRWRRPVSPASLRSGIPSVAT